MGIRQRRLVACKCCTRYCFDPGPTPEDAVWILHLEVPMPALPLCVSLWNGDFTLPHHSTQLITCGSIGSSMNEYQYRWNGTAPPPFASIARRVTLILRPVGNGSKCDCQLVLDSEGVLNGHSIVLKDQNGIWTVSSASSCSYPGEPFPGITLERIDP